MDVHLVRGDLLDQDVDVIVNAWNRNLFPWWLLIPQGVSKAIRRRAGSAPFRELRSKGVLALGAAVETGPGELEIRAIIHVAGIGFNWLSSERSIRLSVRNAISIARERGYRSIAFPLIGAGTGGKRRDDVRAWMRSEFEQLDYPGEVRIVELPS